MPMLPRPGPRLVMLLLPGVLLALLAPLSRVFLYATLAVDAVALLVWAYDVWLWRAEIVDIAMSVPQRASRNHPFEQIVRIRHSAQRTQTMQLTQRHPEHLEPQTGTTTARIAPGEVYEHRLLCTAARRGLYSLHAPVVEYATPLQLGRATVWPGDAQTVEVLPSTRDLGRFDALVRQHKLHQMGVARTRQRGLGNEIAGLRPYTPGDPPGRIDWKATARKGNLVSRDMHAERRQNLVLLLDCGRRMAREVDGRSRLDDAVEAALLLGHVALRSDDRVGLLAFADTSLRAVPPVRGYSNAGVLARAMFDLAPVLREPAYEAMAGRAHATFPRRSLMILFTDAIEPESLAGLAKPVRFLSARHLVLCVTFRDASITTAMQRVGDDTDSFFRAGAAADLYVERERHLARLRRAGAMVLETDASSISTDVINRYLDIKARRLL